MKKVLLIFCLIFFCNTSYGACNYQYTISEASNSGNLQQVKTQKTSKLSVGAGLSNNTGYIKFKANNKQVLKVKTPKISSNQALKLINIAF